MHYIRASASIIGVSFVVLDASRKRTRSQITDLQVHASESVLDASSVMDSELSYTSPFLVGLWCKHPLRMRKLDFL